MKIGRFEIKMPFDGALRGIGGDYEINRVLGGFGALGYGICANLFVGWGVIVQGREFDIVAYCVAFPGGLAAIIGAAATATGYKDTKVASAKVIERTGAVPVAAPAGPKVPPPAEEIEPSGDGPAEEK